MVGLTPREQEILSHLAKGYRYKEIADTLFISIETVRTHLRNIYDKLHVRSRTEAVLKYLKSQLTVNQYGCPYYYSMFTVHRSLITVHCLLISASQITTFMRLYVAPAVYIFWQKYSHRWRSLLQLFGGQLYQ